MTDISETDVGRLSVILIGVSSLAALTWLIGSQYDAVRGITGSLGSMSAIIATGVAAWFAMRSRQRTLAITALLSLAPLVFWIWIFYRASFSA